MKNANPIVGAWIDLIENMPVIENILNVENIYPYRPLFKKS